MVDVQKIYIVHFEKLVERKKYLDSILPSFGIDYEYKVHNEETDQLSLTDTEFTYLFDKKVYCRELSVGEISVTVSHLKIYKEILERGYEKCLIIEDDAVFEENFLEILGLIGRECEDYDFVFISTCCNLRASVVENQYLKRSETSRCASGYIVNVKNLSKVLDHSRNFFLPIDEHLNQIKNYSNLEFAWCEPPIIIQGSENYYKSNLR